MTTERQETSLPAGLDSPKHREVAQLIAASYRATGRASVASTGMRGVAVAEWVQIAKTVARQGKRPVKDLGHVVELTDWPKTGPERLIHHANPPRTASGQDTLTVDVSAVEVPIDLAPRTAADTALGARDRVLAAADFLFTRDGIRAVGVQDILDHADVNRAAFYRHFPTRADVEIEYVRRLCKNLADTVTRIRTDAPTPRDALLAVAEQTIALIKSEEFRGDPLVNAASEYPHLQHPIRQLVRQQHTWYHHQLVALFDAAGHDDPSAEATRMEVTCGGLVAAALTGMGTASAPELRTLLTTLLT